MVIWLASYPRSGNTFFRMLLFHVCGFPSYSVHKESRLERIGASAIIGHQPLPAPVEQLARDSGVHFVKTHDLPSDDRPAIYLVRDGRDALVSYARYQLAFQSRTQRMKQLLGGDRFRRTLRQLMVECRFGTWSRHVLQWLDRPRGRTVTVRYEDLIREPSDWMSRSLERLGLNPAPPAGGIGPSFESLHARWPEFFRKGRVGAWREEMPADLHELFWQHHGEAMKACGYSWNPA